MTGFLTRDDFNVGSLKVKGQVFAEVARSSKPVRSKFIEGNIGLAIAAPSMYPVRYRAARCAPRGAFFHACARTLSYCVTRDSLQILAN